MNNEEKKGKADQAKSKIPEEADKATISEKERHKGKMDKAENKAYDSENVPLTFAVDQSDLQVNYSLDQQTDLAANTNITLSGLSKGSHHLLVWTTDAFGNPADYQIFDFSITKETATLQTAQPSPNETRLPNDFPFMDWGLVGLVLAIIIVVGLAAYFKKYHN